MICDRCSAPNREGAAFCRNCGYLLLSTCPTCGATAAAGVNFCDSCGRPLSPQAWTVAATTARAQPDRPTFDPTSPALSTPSDTRPHLRMQTPPAPPVPPASLAPPTTEPTDPWQQFIPRELQDKLRAARRSGTMAGERRVVTMLFCDIKGSTALACLLYTSRCV